MELGTFYGFVKLCLVNCQNVNRKLGKKDSKFVNRFDETVNVQTGPMLKPRFAGVLPCSPAFKQCFVCRNVDFEN